MKHIWILWWWQLAQMTLRAAQQFSCETTILEKDAANICKELATRSIDGSLQSPEDIRKIVQSVDITTYEIEHIDIQTLLDLEKEGHCFAPSPKVLEIIQDKWRQKDFFMQHSLPTAPYTIVHSVQDIPAIVADFSGDMLVVKSCTWWYDGKWVVVSKKNEIEKNAQFDGACLVEEYIEQATEIAVMVGRDMHGNISCREPVEMVFNMHNTLAYQLCPARISQDLSIQAQNIAKQTIEAFSGVWVFAVEFFLTKTNELLINEIAPRPHNSWHHTIDACVTSQFSQLCTILLWETLWSTKSISPSMMINLLWPEDHVWDYGLKDAQALEKYENVHIHMYGKQPSKPNRKLGHITLTAISLESLLTLYKEIEHLLYLVPIHD